MKSRLWLFGTMAAAALVLTGCPEKRRPAGATPAKPGAAPTAPASGNAKTPEAKGPLADYAHTLDKSEKKAAEVTGLLTLNQAVQQFNVIEGRLPRTLDELVETRYLPKLPAAPRGKRFIYDSKAGEVTVADVASSAPAGESAPESAVKAAPAVEAAPTTPGSVSISLPGAAPLPEESAPAAEKPAE